MRNKLVEGLSVLTTSSQEITSDILALEFTVVNACMVGDPNNKDGTGKKDYPLADRTVGGGMVAKMSPTFPHTSIDVGYRAIALPSDGSVPGMKGWKWVHTPGHTEGHVCLFREKDRILIAGDAFTTVKQESLLSVVTQKEQISGLPAYLPTDWEQAEASVKRIRDLEPSLVIPSHGQPMKGE